MIFIKAFSLRHPAGGQGRRKVCPGYTKTRLPVSYLESVYVQEVTASTASEAMEDTLAT